MLPQKMLTAFLFGVLLCFLPSAKLNAKNIFIGNNQVAEIQKDISGIQTENNNSDIHADENGIWITNTNADTAWFKTTAFSETENYSREDSNHIVIIPARDSETTENATEYIEMLNQYLSEVSDNNKLYITSATPTNNNENKTQFNEYLKENLPDTVTFIDTATTLKNTGYQIKNDNIYDAATNQKIFNIIKNSLTRKKFENGIMVEGEEDSSWMNNVTFTVAFNPNGGKGDITAQTVKFNQPIDHFPQLIKEGYEIDHWEASDGTVITEETPIINDMTLIAIWKPDRKSVV